MFNAPTTSLALTGNIGCGKSTALAAFAGLGWDTFDSDAAVRALLASDTAVHQALRDKFGPEVIGPSGADRPFLARRVFTDPRERLWLEGLLHPLVRRGWESARTASLAAGRRFVAEIPLLFEKNLESAFPFCVCLWASETVQLRRLALRGLSTEEARLRLSTQMPLAEKARRADVVLLNDGPTGFLHSQVRLLSARLTETFPTVHVP